MAALTDLYPHVRPDVPNCMDVIMLDAIRKAAIKFCELTHYWETTVASLTMANGVAEYPINQPVEQNIIRLSQVIDPNGRQLHFRTEADMDALSPVWRKATGPLPTIPVMINPRLIRMYPVPNADADGKVFTVKAIVKPSPNATTIDDYVYDDYYVHIAAGAKEILCAMPHKTWTNYALVPYYRSIFEEGVSDAKLRLARGFSGETLRVRPVKF